MKIIKILCKTCPNCGMPLEDELLCNYCDWTKNVK